MVEGKFGFKELADFIHEHKTVKTIWASEDATAVISREREREREKKNCTVGGMSLIRVRSIVSDHQDQQSSKKAKM